jgi:ribosomal protein S18 acetylase RimI-like enzyme
MIEELVVQAGCRSRGVGSMLVKALVAEARTRCCAEVAVSTMPANQGAVRFYTHLGFVDEALLLEIDVER